MQFGPRVTRMVKYLVIANVVVFLWQGLAGMVGAGEVTGIFGLNPYFVTHKLYLWQLVTYLFLHGGVMHILFNMFGLWMFGSELERTWGERQFLKYYFLTGIGAGVFSVLVEPSSMVTTIGASGAVYGVLLAYGMMFPNRYVFLYFLVPVKVKYFIGVLVAVTFFSALSAPGSTVSHVAHLGGLLFGFLYLKGWLSLKGVRQAYYRWKLKRMRARFEVYYGKKEADKSNPTQKDSREDDFWIN